MRRPDASIDESVAMATIRPTRAAAAQPDDLPFVPAEANWLFSNRSHWYPQAQVTDYATATVRITVPAEYTVVASGVRERLAGSSSRSRRPAQRPRARSTFGAPQPVRYLSVSSGACSASMPPPSRSTSCTPATSRRRADWHAWPQ